FTFSSCQNITPSAPDGFELHPDFSMKEVAAEPLIFDPVDMEFDEEGRAFVLEMPGYPQRDEESRLVYLEDEDGDGHFDKRHLYADSLHLASSFMPYKEGMLVASPPHLIYLKDTDGDMVADEKKIIMEGFRVGNLQHNYNGLTYGLDNWIYAANGGNSGKPYFIGESDNPLVMRGDDFRFKIDEKLMERVGESSGGFELAFDNWGRMYETHNLEHVSQLVFQGKYLENLPVSSSHSLLNISDHDENGLARLYPIGEQDTRVNHPEQSGYFSGACGISFYGGGAFPAHFNDNLFVADVVLNLIHIDILTDEGVHSVASRNREKQEFLASRDRTFRPVNLATGPDGALYVLDMHRAVIEHPEWIPDEIEVNLDLSEGKDQGRIYRIEPKTGLSVKRLIPDKQNPASLLAALAHPNQWTRMTAQRLIVESGNKGLAGDLKEALRTSPSTYQRLHALWSLEGLDELSQEDIQIALKDKEAGVRENVLRASEPYLESYPELGKDILALCKDPMPRVRMRTALALGRLPEDHFASYARDIFYGLQHIIEAGEGDTWSGIAATTAMKKQPLTFARQLLAHSEDRLSSGNREALLSLSKLLVKRSATDMQVLLENLAMQSQISSADKAYIVEGMSEAWPQHMNNRPIELSINKLEKEAEIELLQACGKLRKAMNYSISPQIQTLIGQAKKEIHNKDLSVEKRLEYLKLLSLADFSEREESLYKMLDNMLPYALQEEALMQLWKSDEETVGKRLLALWKELGPEARKGAANILLYKEKNHPILLSALENKEIILGEMNFDLERRRTLLWSENEEVKKRAESLFSDAGVLTRKVAMEEMKPAIDLHGEISAGKKQFELLCASCHQYGSQGKNVGPVLTEINRKSKESLLHDILDPNAAVDSKYLNHSIKTKNGNIYSGIIFAESDDEIELRMTGGKEEKIAKQEIEKLSSLGISLMPEGLEGGMSVQDMADLLAFLQQAPQ
ncbi:MAG: PVC-type heme-binding CxxCH protein, partial [Bacteroidota bacterium]